MSEELERAIAHHYGVSGLTERILSAVAAAGIDPERVTAEDLAPIDEFHIGGRAATRYAVAKMRLSGSEHVLDIGCGIGGAARYLASTVGCRVTGIDLTPEYVETAVELSARTDLAERTAFAVASALDLPYADATFDAALTLHVAMNIKDRPRFYSEAARVLKPGAVFCIYDVMQGRKEGLQFPVPWADTPTNSHLETAEAMGQLLANAGFGVEAVEDRTDYGIAFFRERLTAGGPPPKLGLHLLMGDASRTKFENMLRNLEQGSIAPVLMLARRSGS